MSERKRAVDNRHLSAARGAAPFVSPEAMSERKRAVDNRHLSAARGAARFVSPEAT